MSYNYRKKRIQQIIKYWGMQKNHDLMASYKMKSEDFIPLKMSIKLFVNNANSIESS